MKTTSPDKIIFRCSGLGEIMTDGRGKDELGETCKSALIKVYVDQVHGRHTDITNKYLEKGNAREFDALHLVSLVNPNKTIYRKNSTRLTNEFITGEPDASDAKAVTGVVDITTCNQTLDTKCSWSAETFFAVQKKGLDKAYEWQGRGYMALTGATSHTVAYCLVNGTLEQIQSEKMRLVYKMGYNDPIAAAADDEYVYRCKIIERNHIFDMAAFREEYPGYDLDTNVAEWSYDIPKHRRVFMQTIQRDDALMQACYEKIKLCRQWIYDNFLKHDL